MCQRVNISRQDHVELDYRQLRQIFCPLVETHGQEIIKAPGHTGLMKHRPRSSMMAAIPAAKAICGSTAPVNSAEKKADCHL